MRRGKSWATLAAAAIANAPFTPRPAGHGESVIGGDLDRLVQYACDVADAMVAEAHKRTDRETKEADDREAAEKKAAEEKRLAELREKFPVGSIVRDTRHGRHHEDRAKVYEVVDHRAQSWGPDDVLVRVEGRTEPFGIEARYCEHTGHTTAPPSGEGAS